MAAPRTRLACAACTRRKVKCSKTVPCNNCSRRGEESLCGVDGDRQSSLWPATSESRNAEVEYLRRRVDELQEQVARERSTDHIQSSVEVRGSEVPQSPDHASASQAGTQDESDATEVAHDSVVQDAASILEFLAWGRRKDPDVHVIVSPGVDSTERHENASDAFVDCSSLSVLQLLVPSASHVQQLIGYHCDALLWYHGSFFTPTFRAQLQVFWNQHGGNLTSPGINLQWVALLFSVMAGTLTCAPPAQAQVWGYRDAEQATLSKRWFQAVTICLNHANYTSNLSIFSCQAIATSTISAHLLGFSSSQSIHLAAAVRIAQSLGLHRLGFGATGSTTEKEIGRRVWTQLCSQDWFGIPFSESYLINPVYSTSEPALHCHDHDLTALPLHIPTITSYCRFLYDIAAIMPQLQDGLMSCNTAYTRYEQVLKWDARLRSLAIQERPAFLSNVALDPSWPPWIPWARRALAISSSHKIIMIHRSFLSDSFTNNAFAFTRRTCLAASKTIIKEYKLVVQENGPVLWIHQVFAVAAAIILSLDILHRNRESHKHTEHQELVESVVAILRSCRNSMIAARGIKLLEALLVEISRSATLTQGTKRNRDGSIVGHFNVSAFVKTFSEDTGTYYRDITTAASHEAPPTYNTNETDRQAAVPSSLDLEFAFGSSMLDSTNGFENLLYLANHDFSGSWI